MKNKEVSELTMLAQKFKEPLPSSVTVELISPQTPNKRASIDSTNITISVQYRIDKTAITDHTIIHKTCQLNHETILLSVATFKSKNWTKSMKSLNLLKSPINTNQYKIL
jgi:hypothetical protein